MKAVIFTQYRENYGTAENPHWKFKGGSTFVVPNLTEAQAEKIRKNGCPTISELVTSYTPMTQEYVLDVSVVEDDKVVCDPWETVTKLHYVGGEWHATEVTENDEYGCMRPQIARKVVTYVLGKFEETVKVSIVMKDGRELSYAEATKELV